MNNASARIGPSGHVARARILVIDDEPANTLILERLLKQAGYASVRTTNDPREGLELCSSFAPDLVLLDLHMPHVDGYQVLRDVADPERHGLRPRVVVLTADVTQAAKERALSLGATDFLTKPLEHLEVLLRIRNHLDTRFLELEQEQRVNERTQELRASLEQLRRAMEERRLLTARLVTAQEEERKRIAADIHDDTVQTMVAVGIRLELLARRLTDPDQRAEMERLRATVGESLTGLRNLLFELIPPSLEREGLGAALAQHLARLREGGGPAYEVRDDLAREPIGERRVVLFRVAQEALANVRKHAAAANVTVALAEEGSGVRLDVTDDGRGFVAGAAERPLPGHLGLPAMRERAELAGGWCRVESAPGVGTTVTAWVPFDDEFDGLDDPGGA